jgi:hypothetical protein
MEVVAIKRLVLVVEALDGRSQSGVAGAGRLPN